MVSTDWVVPLLFLALGVLGTSILLWIIQATRQSRPRRAVAVRSSTRDLHLSATPLPPDLVERKQPPADDRYVAWDALTARQQEVALLAAQGKSSPAIAHELVLSPRTVDNHLFQIYKKLRINSRAGLKRRLLDLGVLSAPPLNRDK